MELINKETIVQWAKDRFKSFDPNEITSGRYELARLLEFINTLKTKEVDLAQEIDNIWNPRFNLGWDEKSLLSINHEGFTTIAKHFFELGIKATQKGEEYDRD